jgi:long-chain acyl-CoA synthetase
VVAVLKFRPGGADTPPGPLLLSAWCRQSLEAYKSPRQYFVCTDWRLTASGKTDHPVLARSLRQHLDGDAATQADLPCLTPWR